ncbi:MAG: molybdopterin-binding protein [Caldilineaceae bacterium]
MSTESPYPMLEVAAALALVLEQATPLSATVLPISKCTGLFLAENVYAASPIPPFPASVKDGYAVIAADGPGDYPIIEEVTAGRVAAGKLSPGTVTYITTGAPVPDGADAVVMVEETSPQPSRGGQRYVHIGRQVQPGDDIRPIGIDIQAGDLVLAAGSCLDAAEIGLLATVGVTQVPVYPQPRVAILSTGDELVEPEQQPGPGQIRDSNRAMLCAAVESAGGVPIDLGIASDNSQRLREQMIMGFTRGDILLTSGGVSMGELDLIKPILEELGTVHFGRILMKPGKPLTFATIRPEVVGGGSSKLVFGLPGNPVSSLVTFYLFVVPALRKLAGRSNPHLQRVQAQLAQPLALDPSRPEYHRATIQWDATQSGQRRLSGQEHR